MHPIFPFALAVIFVIANGIPQLYFAKSLGFKLKPTGLAFMVGAVGNLVTGTVVPISAQAETLTMAGQMKKMPERIMGLLIAAAVGIVMGLTGSIGSIVDFAGSSTINAMMAGVGFILTWVAISMVKKEPRTGLISIFFALLIYFTTHNLVYTIAGSVFISSFDFVAIQKRRISFAEISKEVDFGEGNGDYGNENEEWRFWKGSYWSDFKLLKPKLTAAAVFGGLSFICLNIGANISFGSITSSIAGVEPNIDALTVINSVADIPAVLFGGAPLEAIISGTAEAPDLGGISGPWLAAVVMMAVFGVLVLLGVVSKLGRYIPAESIAGFLLIIGFFVTVVPGLGRAFAVGGDPAAAAVALGVTVLSKNAFFGLVAGLLIYQLPQWIDILFPLF